MLASVTNDFLVFCCGRTVQGVHKRLKVSSEEVSTFRRDARELVERASAQSIYSADAASPDVHEHTVPRELVEADLPMAVEGLQIAEEELRVQTDELLTGHEALEQERLRYVDLFEHAPDAYLLTNSRGTIQQANAAGARLLGIRQEFIAGKPISLYLGELSRRRVRRLFEEGPGPEPVVEWYLQLKPRDRAPLHAAVTVAAVYDATAKVQEYRWLIRELPLPSDDVAERVPIDAEIEESRTATMHAEKLELIRMLEVEQAAREAADAASRAKSEFLAVLSHELRTPLQALIGYTEILETGVHGELSGAQLEDVRRMHRGEQHLLRLVNSVLEFLKLESGFGMELESRAFDVPDVLRGLHTLIAPQLGAKRLVFVCRYDDPPPRAHADPGQVQQIVLNLLANAVKFTPPGGTITVETKESEGSVAITVADTGIGIPPQMLDAIFDPFVQAHRGADSEARGTGLGLAIGRRLAEAMEGSICVESTPGAGSRFTLRLPIAASG